MTHPLPNLPFDRRGRVKDRLLTTEAVPNRARQLRANPVLIGTLASRHKPLHASRAGVFKFFKEPLCAS